MHIRHILYVFGLKNGRFMSYLHIFYYLFAVNPALVSVIGKVSPGTETVALQKTTG